ncbi:hypothetical protein AcV5_000699 [Taiwanofungus camphoratus]|nr:hypothetical protein AcV5_000699 [Antrodia cinnamomea]
MALLSLSKAFSAFPYSNRACSYSLVAFAFSSSEASFARRQFHSAQPSGCPEPSNRSRTVPAQLGRTVLCSSSLLFKIHETCR